MSRLCTMGRLLETIRPLLIAIIWLFVGVLTLDEINRGFSPDDPTAIGIAVGLNLVINWMLQKGELEEENE